MWALAGEMSLNTGAGVFALNSCLGIANAFMKIAHCFTDSLYFVAKYLLELHWPHRVELISRVIPDECGISLTIHSIYRSSR